MTQLPIVDPVFIQTIRQVVCDMLCVQQHIVTLKFTFMKQ